MSRPPFSGLPVAYDPLPNPQEPLDIHPSTYPPSSPPVPAMSAHQVDDFSPDPAHPRFLGTIDGQPGRDSLVTNSTHPQSDGLSSLYALNNNPDSVRGSRPGSAAMTSPFNDPRSPGTPADDAYDASAPLANNSPEPRYLSEKQAAYANPSKSRRRVIILSAIAALIIIAAAIVAPLVAIKHHSNNRSSSSNPSKSSTSSAPSASSTSSSKTATSGGDGSTITMEDGTTFTYKNPFGGTWYWDPNDPFNNSAQAQSWTPALNEPFNYGTDHIRGYVTVRLFSSRCQYLHSSDNITQRQPWWLVGT